GKTLPYEKKDITSTVLHTVVLDYGEVTDISPDIRLTFHNAGHIVGSAIPHLHVGEGVYNLAFAQDIKFAKSNLLDSANARFPRLETLFIESTYGKPQDILPPRIECEKQLRNIVLDTINKGGKVLIPVLAVGRAQEILVVLEGLMRNNEIPNIPIYTDGMIREASAITTAHPEFLSKSVRERIFHAGQNPFLAEQIKQVASMEERELIMTGDPAIIVATSGMLSGGPSVMYFKSLCQDSNNAMIFVSYQGKGTLGSKIQKGITEIQMVENGKTVMYHIDMAVHSITGFTGHSDRKELESYIRKVTPKPERVVVIHGEESKVSKFASWVYKNTKRESLAPPNGTTIRLR
ncbi:MAG: MBL fold metallo-hydrolase RNA specificity domain-containing protein, partial [Candidatus Heimdallarchaeaceae archaeon]